MTPARVAQLARALSAALRRSLRLAAAVGGRPVAREAARRAERRRGRAALRALGPQPGPAWRGRSHPCRSLTHAGGIAIAAGVADPAVHGIGVDLELRAGIAAAAARFYLKPAEAALARSDRERLRLWTVKEAVFKADPANAGRWLFDYALPAPAAWRGVATAAGSDLSFEYACVELDDGAGFLSAAVAVTSGDLS